MIHNSAGKKLSKRDGATDVMAYKEMGYTPQALLNFLVRLGWSHGDQEIFSFREMIELFNPKDINKSASIYNTEKLDWLSGHYIKNMPNAELAELLTEYDVYLTSHDKKEILLDALKERAKTLKELATLVEEIVQTPHIYDETALKKAFKEESIEVLNAFGAKLAQASELHLPTEYHALMEEVVSEMGIGFGKIGMPLRVALLGKMGGPNIDVIMAVIGREETLVRIANAITHTANA
jgi:glutamyl-tRNA synthetase